MIGDIQTKNFAITWLQLGFNCALIVLYPTLFLSFNCAYPTLF